MNTPQEFAALLAALRALPATGDAALCTLTHTSGSTFRRAGARMLVLADGRLVRGLSGGCPEQDIAMRAREALAERAARVVRYDREQGFDVLVEMGCGGELEVLVEPLLSPADWQFAEVVDEVLQARRSGVLATLFRLNGLCLSRPRRWLWSDTVRLDELGDAALGGLLLNAAQGVPANREPGLLDLPGDTGLATVFVERLQPPRAALLFGTNTSSHALARTLHQLGWLVTVVDHRPPAGDADELPAAILRVTLAPAQCAAHLSIDARTFAVVMTHNLERDIEYLQALRDTPLAYIGAIGARRRAARLLEATGLTPERLRTPAGLDIGSETPEEIAIAIAAEMLAVANRTPGGALTATQAPIHR